jgi:hypothetical protein
MILPEIKKTPIVIIASPRTGSNSLANHMGVVFSQLKLFKEPDHIESYLAEFLDYAKNNNEYIIKIIASSLIRYPDWIKDIFFNGSSHVFRLKRRSLVEQIASHYIARHRDVWYYNIKNFDDWRYKIEGPIDIDVNLIDSTIQMVKYDIELVNRLHSDSVIMYEDMIDLVSQDMKTPLPANYLELIDVILERYK